MKQEVKTFSGAMNLDDSNDIMPHVHHKEARNGVFRGNVGLLKFQAIRGNRKVTNSQLKTNNRP